MYGRFFCFAAFDGNHSSKNCFIGWGDRKKLLTL